MAGILYVSYMVSVGVIVGMLVYVAIAGVMYWRDVQREKRERGL